MRAVNRFQVACDPRKNGGLRRKQVIECDFFTHEAATPVGSTSKDLRGLVSGVQWGLRGGWTCRLWLLGRF